MSLNVLVKRYIVAYNNCFVKQQRVDALQDLKVFCSVVLNKKTYYSFLVSPVVSLNIKKKALSDIPFLQNRPSLKNFILLLNSKNRLSLLTHIFSIVDEFILEEQSKVQLYVHSPVELTSSQIQQISSLIQTKTNKTPLIEFKLDKSILGGVKIVSNNTIYDGTIINTLNKLKLSFN